MRRDVKGSHVAAGGKTDTAPIPSNTRKANRRLRHCMHFRIRQMFFSLCSHTHARAQANKKKSRSITLTSEEFPELFSHSSKHRTKPRLLARGCSVEEHPRQPPVKKLLLPLPFLLPTLLTYSSSTHQLPPIYYMKTVSYPALCIQKKWNKEKRGDFIGNSILAFKRERQTHDLLCVCVFTSNQYL